MKTQTVNALDNTIMEKVYLQCEEDPATLNKVLDNLLQIVISDPEGVRTFSRLVKEDYPLLFRSLMLLLPQEEKGDDSSCCLDKL